MNKSLGYIASAVNGILSESADKNRMVNGFFSDSRYPCEDKLFLALKGERVDGNSFVPDLVSKGYAVITDDKNNLSLKGDVICVPDVRQALQNLAKYYRENELSHIPFVGITGSVGKTTTKDMVAVALSCGFDVHKTQGNFNSQIGLPQTILAANPENGCAVVELGMSYKGEMERISRCASPDISVITNIGYSHIENLGSREAIRDEKLKIADFSKTGSVLILNGDEPLLKNLDIPDKKLVYVSVSDKNCDCYAEEINQTATGILFKAVIFGSECNVNLNVVGSHYVVNSLFALAVCHLLGLDLNKSAEALSKYKSDGKRQHIYESNGHTVISDCYNAAPQSMQAALSVLSSAKGRRIAVLGDMLELGDASKTLHQEVGGYTTDSADVLVTYGELSNEINSASQVKEKYHFNKNQSKELLDFLKEFIREGDTVLYKASNSMKLFDLIV